MMNVNDGKMILSIIVAASENQVIGKDNGLIWRLSADMKHFKQKTTGHTVIMGRKTFESIGKALPNRRNIVISTNMTVAPEGCELVSNLELALERVKDEDEVFVIGGGMLYRKMWETADRLYLTRVHVNLDGDTFIPEIDPAVWKEVDRQEFSADEKNEYNYSFIDYIRR